MPPARSLPSRQPRPTERQALTPRPRRGLSLPRRTLEYVMTPVRLTLDEHADDLLSQDPFALLLGMLLDQQMPMERAFLGPAKLAERLGQNPLQPHAIATWDPDGFAEICARPPAVHRYPAVHGHPDPGAGRCCGRALRRRHLGPLGHRDDGEEVRSRLEALPGFGPAKAAIFTALLGKQLGVRPPRVAAGQRAVRRGRVVPVGGRRGGPRVAAQGARDQAGGQGRRAAGPLTWP